MKDCAITICKWCKNEKLRKKSPKRCGSYIYVCPCREVKAQLKMLDKAR